MDNTPDSRSLLVVVIKDCLYICSVLQVSLEDLDLRIGFILLGSIFGKLGECNLGYSVEGFREGVVEAS